MFGHDVPECVVEVLPDAPAAGALVLVELELPVEPVVAALAIATPPPARAPVTASSANAALMDLISCLLSLTKPIETRTAVAGL
jgi:hypothetical protein